MEERAEIEQFRKEKHKTQVEKEKSGKKIPVEIEREIRERNGKKKRER